LAAIGKELESLGKEINDLVKKKSISVFKDKLMYFFYQRPHSVRCHQVQEVKAAKKRTNLLQGLVD